MTSTPLINTFLTLLKLIEVNNISVLSITHDEVVKALQLNPTGVLMKVSRLPAPKEVFFFLFIIFFSLTSWQEVYTFNIKKSDKGGLGFSIAGGSDDLGDVLV